MCIMGKQLDLKVLFLGESGVGKSCLISSFTGKPFETLTPTIGSDVEVKKMTLGNVDVKLSIWDTAGQERFDALIPFYYKDAHGVVFVYDVTRPMSFMKIDDWVEKIKLFGTIDNTVFMIVGNKIDLERKVTEREGMNLARKHRALFFETSAKSNAKVEVAMEELVRKMINTPELWESNVSSEAIALQNSGMNNNNNGGWKCNLWSC